MVKYSVVFFLLLISACVSIASHLKKANLRSVLASSQLPIEDCHKDDNDNRQLDSCKNFDEFKEGHLYPEESKVLYENFLFKSLVDNTSHIPNLERVCKEVSECFSKSIDWILIGECPGGKLTVSDSDDSAQSVSSKDSLDI